MATTQARRSKSHCHGSAIIVTPLQTQPPYSYSLSPSKSVELCPPHWRLPPRRSWRQKLKGLVLKAPPVQPDGRPKMKRMKDSDDYITARAANPWTGQISPSIRSPRSAKCLPATPDSPGDALNLPEPRPPSPPPEPPLRPVIQGATSDERRKISAASLQRRRQGCVSATVPTAVAPEETHSTAGADATSGGDRFILHMPSAREPQPFAYPGRSPAEIARLQHLTRTGIESNERMRRGERWHEHASRPSGGPHHHEQSGCDLRKTSGKPPWKPSGQFRTAAQQQQQDRRGVPPRPGRNLSGCPLERTAGDIHGAHGTPSMSRETPDLFDLPRPADLCAATVARVALSEPQTPAGAKHLDGTDSSPGGLAVDGAVRPTVQAPASSTVRDVSNADETSPPPPQRAVRPRVIPRKPVGVMDSAPRRLERDGDSRLDTGAETHEHQQGPGRATSDLSQLPRVRLVHPALASLPPRQRTWSRPCSLGCETAPATGQCTTQRRTSASSIAGPHPPGHLSTDGAEEEPRVPSSIDTRDLHALISLGGHVLAFLTALTVAWKVGTALAMAIDALLWPFVVPFQIMRWLAGGD